MSNIVTAHVNIPEGYEIDMEKSNFITGDLVYNRKIITYKDVSRELFIDQKVYYTDDHGCIHTGIAGDLSSACELTNSLSEIQVHKMLAYNKLINIARYLNKGWKPNFNNDAEPKFYLCYDHKTREVISVCFTSDNIGNIPFVSQEAADQAIEIMGASHLSALFSY